MARDGWVTTEEVPEPIYAVPPRPWYGLPMVPQPVIFVGIGSDLDRDLVEREAVYYVVGKPARPGQLLCLLVHGYGLNPIDQDRGTQYKPPRGRTAVVVKVSTEAEAAWRLGGKTAPQWYRAVKNQRRRRGA